MAIKVGACASAISSRSPPSLFAFMAPSAPGGAAVAAHSAFWAGAVSGRALAVEIIQKPLVAYFTDRGEALADLPVDVDVNDVEAWRGEWRDIAKSAGISDLVDVRRLVV